MLALKALLAGTGKPVGGSQPRQIAIAVDGKPVRELTIAADQSDVMQQIDVSEAMVSGSHRLSIREQSDQPSAFQVVFAYHVPGAAKPDGKEPLTIRLEYDRAELAVDDVVTATATVVNRLPAAAPMVISTCPSPAVLRPNRVISTAWFRTASSPDTRSRRAACWSTCANWHRKTL